jgi:hypothetical protein
VQLDRLTDTNNSDDGSKLRTAIIDFLNLLTSSAAERECDEKRTRLPAAAEA